MSDVAYLGSTTQRPDEDIAYTVDVSNVGSSPTVNDVKAYQRSDGSDVSDTVLTGSATVSGDVITTPKVGSLTDAVTYQIEVNYTISGNVYEDMFEITCSDGR